MHLRLTMEQEFGNGLSVVQIPDTHSARIKELSQCKIWKSALGEKKTSIEQLGTGQECETQNWIVQYRKLPVDLYSRLTS